MPCSDCRARDDSVPLASGSEACHYPEVEVRHYKAVSAQQAQAANYGNVAYWDYLEKHAEELAEKGVKDAFTRTLSEALVGNDGD